MSATLTRKIATVELVDGRVVQVRITNPDMLRCEEYASQQGWPGLTIEDGVATPRALRLQQTFQAWAALKRTRAYTSGFEQFRDVDCVDLDVDEEEVRPTPPDLGAGSSPSSPGSDDATSTSSSELTTS